MATADCEPLVITPKFDPLESVCDSSYREAIKNSSNFNTRINVDRKHRIPFLDSQTGIAHLPSNLYFNSRQRMPGLKQGQIYTYPSKRWKKRRRQYLNYASKRKDDSDSNDYGIPSTSENPSVVSINEDSKDSVGTKEDNSTSKLSESWYYDAMDMHEADDFYDEADQDSDFDYEDSYSAKMKRKKRGTMGVGRGGGRGGSSLGAGESPARRGGARSNIAGTSGSSSPGPAGRGRRKTMTFVDLSDGDKPFACDRAPSQSKKETTPTKASVPTSSTSGDAPSTASNTSSTSTSTSPVPEKKGSASSSKADDEEPPMPTLKLEESNKVKAKPSPYCDFCLGDTVNKKSGQAEDLVSCSDCGRSGHPTCLLFTTNMKVSVRKYRWQCIECKCCSICGTSDNDDKLLFCDDCDRGYHMYCLIPPIHTPPEGSWSCRLCLKEFYKK